MSHPTAAPDAILDRHANGAISSEVALTQLLLALGTVDAARALLRRRGAQRLASLLERHTEGCAKIEAMIAQGLAVPVAGRDRVEESVADVARLFDACARASEEAGVALYSLGSPERLAAATDELIGWLERARLLRPRADALDFGCGIGRVALALSSRVRQVHGVDVSPVMIDVGRRRCARAANVELVLGSGVDLALWPDARFDLILAVDSMPYVASAGGPLLERLWFEMARVLRSAGALVVFNWSYRGDLSRDRDEAAALAAAADLALLAAGEQPFAIWDGALFHFQKPDPA